MSGNEIEPKPPKIIENLEWFQLHGWRYKGRIVLAVFILLLISIVSIHWHEFWAGSGTFRKSVTQEPSPMVAELPKALPNPPSQPSRRAILSTFDTPVDILRALNSGNYTAEQRQRLAESLYINRWIIHPWNARVKTLPKVENGVWSFEVFAESGDARENAPTLVQSSHDASALRLTLRIHFTGRIKEVRSSMVVVDQAEFQVIDQ